MKTHLLMMGLAGFAATVLVVILACATQAKSADTSAPPPSGGGAAQCGRDSDCKGDRICDHGQCVSPR